MKTPLIYNMTCTLANTEYSLQMPDLASKVLIKTRDQHDLKISFISGQSGSTYWSIPGVVIDGMNDMRGGLINPGMTLYFQSPDAGTVVEFLVYIS